MNLEAFILGTGGMMPLPYRFLTSVLLRREGDLFLFDCGESTQVSLRKLNLKWKKINSIFISHTHADHVTGLPGILMLSSQVDRDEPLFIYGPPRIKEYVETSRRVLEMYINYEIVVKEIFEPGVIYENEEFYIKTIQLNHTRPCVGYSLVEKDRPGIFFPEKAVASGVPKGPLWSQLQRGEDVILENGVTVKPGDVLGEARKGRKFSFITDTAVTSEMPEFVKDSDLLICEGMFCDELKDSAWEKRHMTAVQAAETAKAAGGVKKMGLIHYSPRYTEYDLKHMLKEAAAVFPDTFLSRDGQYIPILNED